MIVLEEEFILENKSQILEKLNSLVFLHKKVPSSILNTFSSQKSFLSTSQATNLVILSSLILIITPKSGLTCKFLLKHSLNEISKSL